MALAWWISLRDTNTLEKDDVDEDDEKKEIRVKRADCL